jgi:2-polyprenyl-6-hydroxyphenyl methylase / 3-demethylubiquinone-9 3-methyltransferase
MVQFDQKEVDKFNNLAHEWWDIDGKFKTLHHINPTRLEFIKNHVSLKNKSVIDVGCGGGILAESMAILEAQVTGIDLAPQSIETAKLHLHESNLSISYHCVNIEDFGHNNTNEFDILTCMEMLEHVPEPEFIISNCAKLLKNDGIAFFSTMNRNIKSYVMGVIAAEYLLNLVPRGTHEYKKFIKPSELRKLLAKHNLMVMDIKGIEYNPFTTKSKLTKDIDINYIIACKKIG